MLPPGLLIIGLGGGEFFAEKAETTPLTLANTPYPPDYTSQQVAIPESLLLIAH